MTAEHVPLNTLLVGLGSPHGDDQVGWLAVRQAKEAFRAPFMLREAAAPADLLDWLDGIERLIVCDACCGGDQPGRVHRWRWPSDSIRNVRGRGSHDLSLPAVLQLAAALGRLPAQVTVLGVEIQAAEPAASVSSHVAAALPTVVRMIQAECGLRTETSPFG